MKVALVHDFLVKLGGAEKVLQSLAEIFPDAPIYTTIYDQKKCGGVFPKERVRSSFLQRWPGFLRRRYPLLLSWMPLAVESFDLMDFDLVISSSGAFSHGVLTSSAAKHICYCHSPMRYAWDYTHRYLEEKKVGWLLRKIAGRKLHKLRLWDQVAADRADFYIANSQHVQSRIEKYYRLPARVIYPPVAVESFNAAGEKGDYFLIIATLTPYKKIDIAVNLFNRLGKKLVIVGDGPQKAYLERIAAKNVEIKGRLSDGELRHYLENCRALIQMNEEDFGINVVEAMACGKPVLAYGVGGAAELVQSGFNGELFYAYDYAVLENALAKLMINELKYHPQKIRERAMQFSGERFKKEILDLVKELQKE